MLFRIAIGVTVKDQLTGFSGVVTGRADYITGCHQYLVQPIALKADGDRRESAWLDDQRLEIVDANIHPATQRVQAKNAETGNGADRPAPRK